MIANPEKPWRQKRRGRVDEIRAVSARLFFQRGYAATSIQDIADSLAMHKTTFYHYYRSKEQILSDILDFSHEQIVAAIAASSTGGGDPAVELHRFFERYARCYLQNLDFAKVAFDEWRNLTGEGLNRQRERRRHYETYVRDLIKRAQRSGAMDSGVDVILAARYAMGAVNALTTWFRADGPLSVDHVASTYADLTVAMLQKPAAPAMPASRRASL